MKERDTRQQHRDTCQQHRDTCQQHRDTCQQHRESVNIKTFDQEWSMGEKQILYQVGKQGTGEALVVARTPEGKTLGGSNTNVANSGALAREARQRSTMGKKMK